MLTTRFSELVGCSVPIQQAGMGGGIATPVLAAAVAAAGGLGMVSVYGDCYTPDVVAQVLDRAAADARCDRRQLPPGRGRCRTGTRVGRGRSKPGPGGGLFLGVTPTLSS